MEYSVSNNNVAKMMIICHKMVALRFDEMMQK